MTPHDTVESFLQAIDFNHPLLNIFKSSRDMAHFAHYMAIFYGYSPQKSDLEEFLQYIDNIFEVVVVFEMLDESLVMLRRKLCWKVC